MAGERRAGEQPPLVADLVQDTIPESSLERISEGVALKRRQAAHARRPSYRTLAAAAALLIAMACTAFALLTGSRRRAGAPAPPPGPLTLEGGSPLGAMAAERAAAEAERFDLSDGSAVELSAGATLRATTNTGHHVALEMESGRATFEVAPGGPRRWSVDAGLARVEVLGTIFTVDSSTERVAVEVDRGRVRVRSPHLPGGLRVLAAGESLVVEAEEPALLTTPSDAGNIEADGGEGDGEPTAIRGWQSLAYGGEFDQAYAILGAAGLERETMRAETMRRLLTLADVARLSGHPREAVLPLEQAVERYPTSESAAVAAFTLGRVEGDQLGRHRRAARAFSQCLDLQAPRALRENAYARLAESHARSGDFEAARRAARDYLRQYPEGRRAAELERWLLPR